jgi:ATP/maltotriose-dependent transcriptional regulator MalT
MDYWFTEADAQGLAGESLLALGRPGEAEPHLRRAVGLLDPGFSRDRALWLCELACARLGMGSVEQACATATEAAVIIRRLDTPHGQRKLADFRATAAPYARTAAIREFDAKYRDLLASPT